MQLSCTFPLSSKEIVKLATGVVTSFVNMLKTREKCYFTGK
jgi:hypothetical protein